MAPSFPQRKIGSTPISALGLGCMSFSIPSSKGPPPVEESLKVLTRAADLGINFWVTSDMYGDGETASEAILGRWFRETGRRNEIFLVTKFGVKRDGMTMTVHGSPEYVREAFAKSLARLGVDHVDMFMAHRIDPKTPIEKTVEAMAALKNEGKTKYIGLSECSARTLSRACAVHPIAAVEMEFSPFALDIETPDTNLLATAREFGVKIMAYSPLGRGFLTGTIKSRADIDPEDLKFKMHPRFSEENFPSNLKLVEGFGELAKEKGCTPSQVALAWVLAQGDDFIPIPGTKHVKYLDDNAGAVKVEFSQDDDKKIRNVLDSIGGSKGARYPEVALSQCFGDTPELDSQ